MVDWNNPTNSSTYSNVLTNLNDKLSSLAKMDFGSDTNLVTGSLRYNTTTKAMERWSGSAWAESVIKQRVFDAYYTTAGTQPTYTVAPTVPWTSYVAGDFIVVSIHSTNTGSATLNVSTLGAITIKYLGNNLVGGELASLAYLYYDGTNFQLLNHGGGWATWTPTFGTIGSLTFTSTSALTAKYQRHGNRVHFRILGTGTLGGSAAAALSFTLPVTAAAAYGGPATWVDIGGTKEAGFCEFNSTTVAYVRRYNNSNYPTSGNAGFMVSGDYEV